MHNLALMAAFNAWANERLYDSVALLSEEDYRGDRGAFFGSVHATLNHLLLVDIAWRTRLEGGVPPFKSLEEILHEGFADLRQARAAEDSALIAHCEALAPANFEESPEMTLLSGSKASIRRDHVLITLFNHQTHHRGQIHCLLTQSDIAPPPLDVLDYLMGE